MSLEEVLDSLEEEFAVPASRLNASIDGFLSEMAEGLAGRPSSLKMLPSFVTRRCNGKETGRYIALDLGGTNFRAVLVTLHGNGRFTSVQKKFVVSPAYQTGDGEQLFDFLASCVDAFLTEQGVKGDHLQLGFTFSFPVEQLSINSGKLINWTKGFSSANVEGRDVVQLLNDALHRLGINVTVAAIVNDTVGTLVAASYADRDAVCGAILGTGTNAAYVERVDQIGKWTGGDAAGEMIINIEWGNFGHGDSQKYLPLSAYDMSIDAASINPGEQPYEKLISGMYLGEIARAIIDDLVRRRLLFGGHVVGFSEPYAFDTKYMSAILEYEYGDDSPLLDGVAATLAQFIGSVAVSAEDRQAVRRICHFVGVRAARLAAVGITAVYKKVGSPSSATFAIDGSVFEHYPFFPAHITHALREVLQDQAMAIRLTLVRDGSGAGAALTAAMAAKVQDDVGDVKW